MKLMIALTFLVVLFGCTNSDDDAPKDTVVIGLNSKPATLDPVYAKDASGQRILSLMFHSFVQIGPELSVTPDAASRWEWNKSQLSLWVPKSLQFHDSTPVTKEDLEYTFQAYQKKDCPFRSSLEGLLRVEITEEQDDYVVTLLFKTYSAKFLSTDLPLIRILPKSHSQLSSQKFAESPIGSGPYQFHSETQTSLKLLRSNTSDSMIQKIEFKFIADESTLLNKLIKGRIHLVQNDLPQEKIEKLRELDHLEVQTYPGIAFTYLLVNFKNPLLAKKETRMAIAHSIDRKRIIDRKLAGLAEIATSLVTPSTQFHNPELKPIEFDPTRAKQLINSLKTNGKDLRLRTSNQRSARDNGFVLAEMIKKSGLKISLESREWSSFFSSIQNGDFDLATMKWVGAIDPDLYRIAFHSSEVPPGRNRGHYINPRLDLLLDEGLAIANPKARREHYYKVQKIVLDDLAIIPLWYDQQVAVIHKSLKNYKPAPNSDFSPILKAKLN